MEIKRAEYSDLVLKRLCYRFCPMCKEQLVKLAERRHRSDMLTQGWPE